MSAAFERRTFAPGELIFKEGDPGDSLYVVESGRGASGGAMWSIRPSSAGSKPAAFSGKWRFSTASREWPMPVPRWSRC
ncbi:MAG: cyclic nucleotide-binding domain-containing protein [Niveispirillum sp.]|nr:cyclic nucleotide-binding domain-containing protein [Niveispirillum sp.]